MENEISTIKYVAAWNWQIISMIFLVSSFILFAMPSTLSGVVFAISFLFIFIGCQYMSMKRRKEFYDEAD